MVKISPSILSADFANLERDIRRVSSADYLHVDVMDGDHRRQGPYHRLHERLADDAL